MQWEKCIQWIGATIAAWLDFAGNISESDFVLLPWLEAKECERGLNFNNFYMSCFLSSLSLRQTWTRLNMLQNTDRHCRQFCLLKLLTVGYLGHMHVLSNGNADKKQLFIKIRWQHISFDLQKGGSKRKWNSCPYPT